MSKRYLGGIITKNATEPTASSANGVWSLGDVATYRAANLWPIIPKAPTIGTATAGGASASVTFTAPTDTGSGPITSFTVTSNPGGVTASGSSSPITVTGLTVGTAYTFTVTATNAAGTSPPSAASNSATPFQPVGQNAYTTPGTYSWVAPTGVTSVSVVAVGGGGAGSPGGNFGGPRYCGSGGSGAGLGYKNNYTVVPGTSYTVVVGAGGAGKTSGDTSGNNGANSYFVDTSTCAGFRGLAGTNSTGPSGGSYAGDGGANGGAAGNGGVETSRGGGGGAAGYSGNGGTNSGGCGGNGVNASDGGAQGRAGGSGGGVGILGEGSSGANGSTSVGAGGGSGGTDGKIPAYGPSNLEGGVYGAGTGGASFVYTNTGDAGGGAVRIIWPGDTRYFPSTNTADQ